MYRLAGITGAISLAAFFLLLVSLVERLFGEDSSDGASGLGLTFVLALLAIAAGVASVILQRRSERDGSATASPRVELAEGILTTLVGVFLAAVGFYWLQLTGGILGLHLVGLAIGGSLTLHGIQRLWKRGKRTRSGFSSGRKRTPRTGPSP